WKCESCGYEYPSSQMNGSKCIHCSYIRPMMFPTWYPSSPKSCEEAILSFPSGETRLNRVLAGVMPHAGWFFSGPVASRVATIFPKDIEVFVVFGAVHRMRLLEPCMLLGGKWTTPFGAMEIDTPLAVRILKYYPKIIISPRAHETEHSIELEIPFLHYYYPQAKIVPIMTPPSLMAKELGHAVGKAAKEDGRKIAFVASSDFTHYGINYGICDFGPLPQALPMIHQQDGRLLNKIIHLREEETLEEALTSQSACGPGAILSALSASKELGAKGGEVLEYTTSMELRPRESSDSTVGYGAVVLG
ncbi:MAG: AmmeMemoRadiSam system protein B, partial [Planctomycetota bacterium]